MHIEIVTLDRVFDIQRRTGFRHNKPHTQFSFECQGKKHYHLYICGWPELTEGHRLAFAFSQAGHWQKILAFKNLTTGELAKPSSAIICLNVLSVAIVNVFLVLSFDSATSTAGRYFSAFAILLITSVGAALIGSLIRTRKAITALNNIDPASECSK